MKPKMQHLTIPEIKALLAAVPQPRHRLMLLVAFNHGLRVEELINMRGQDIQHGRVYVKRKKGSEKTTHQYTQAIDPDFDECSRLAELAKTLKSDERLFTITASGVAKVMKRAGKRAGLDAYKMHPHALKHSCAHAALAKLKVNEVQAYLGHKSGSSTLMYLKVSAEEASQKFQKAY